MRRAMEMEASPMLSQTGGEKGAHHCLDWDLLQLESGFKSVMAKYKIFQLVTSKNLGVFIRIVFSSTLMPSLKSTTA